MQLKNLATLIVLLLLTYTPNVSAQGLVQNENNKSLFPLLGSKAKEKGYDLPLPVGISVNYHYQDMDLLLNEMTIGVVGDPTTTHTYDKNDLDVKSSTAQANTITVRPDLWILPMLNVYGIFGKTDAQTKVDVYDTAGSQLAKTNSSTEGGVYGFGFLLAGKVGPVFTNFEFSQVWSDLDILNEPASVQNASLRTGHVFSTGGKMTVTPWVGVTYQGFSTKDGGTYGMQDAVSMVPADQQESASYVILGMLNDLDMSGAPTAEDPTGTTEFQQNYLAMMNSYIDPLSEEISYELDKKLEKPFSILIGLQLEFNKKIQVRAEGGFLGDRTYGLASIGYRFNL